MRDIPKETIVKAQGGDIEAFEEIYKETSSFVFNVTLRIMYNWADAEEVTQDVFIKLYRGLKNFRFKSSLKTWIYRITVNSAINAYNKRKKLRQRTVEYDDAIGDVASGENEEKKIYKGDNEEAIRKALDILSPEQRACVVLRNIEGLSYKEIAESLGVKINTVRTRLKRSREKMLGRFKKEGGQNEV